MPANEVDAVIQRHRVEMFAGKPIQFEMLTRLERGEYFRGKKFADEYLPNPSSIGKIDVGPFCK